MVCYLLALLKELRICWIMVRQDITISFIFERLHRRPVSVRSVRYSSGITKFKLSVPPGRENGLPRAGALLRRGSFVSAKFSAVANARLT